MTAPTPALDPRLARTLVTAATGALAGALCLFIAYVQSPDFVARLDTQPGIIRGLYPTEHEGDGLSFAWTRDRVTLTFDGLDRSVPWTLLLRAKAGRGPGLPLPTVTIDVDGVTRGTAAIGSAWQDVRTEVPAAPSPGRVRPTRLTLHVAPTFVPGPSDSRSLGLVLDEVRLVPAGATPSPPRRALLAAALAGGLIGAALAAVGVPLLGALALTLLFVVAQAAALSTGAAPYTRAYLDLLPWLVGGIAAVTAALTGIAAMVRRAAVSTPAAIAIGVSLVCLVLELEGLLHPAKSLVDALFHAHRLAGVLDGHYFFTQPMPSGVEFPYAIGLYVTAAPWASLTRDHVLLLRLVVAVAHALAALSLYPLVARRWGSPGAAIGAVAAYHLTPLPLVVIGNANLTYAFGQSIATIALAAAMTWPLAWRRPADAIALTAIIALGLLSHVGLVPLLGGLLGASALLVALRGVGPDRPAGWLAAGAGILAAILAVGLYYAHFGDAFRSAQRVRESAPPAAVPGSPSAGADAGPDAQLLSAVDTTPTSRPARLRRALALAASAYGLPLLALGLVGLSRLRWADRDRLSLMVAASVVVGLLVAGAAIVAPVEARFERYTDEFISRLYYALTPVVAVLAARAVAWLWSVNATRGVAIVTAALAVFGGAHAWLGWIW